MLAGGDHFPSSCDRLHGRFMSFLEETTKAALSLSALQVNLLSVVLNAAPITPEEDEDVSNLMADNPQCMTFVLFMIW